MRNKTLQKMILIAIFSALMIIVTALIKIPIPGNMGFLHFGDVFIFVAAVAIDPLSGGLVGALGGALGDLGAGYGQYIPFTIIIKFISGLIAGGLYRLAKKNPRLGYLAFVPALIWNAGGYLLTDWLLYSWQVAAMGILANLLQGVIATILAIIILEATKGFKLMRPDQLTHQQKESEDEKKPD